MTRKNSVKRTIAGAAVLSTALLGIVPAAQANGLPENCSPSIGCAGIDSNGNVIHAPGHGASPEDHAKTVQCFGGLVAAGAGGYAAASLAAGLSALGGGVATIAGPCRDIAH